MTSPTLMHTLDLTNEAATQELAAKIAKVVVCGDVLRLEGELGAGKSTFTRYLLKALGSQTARMPSPTFTIVQTYADTRLPIAHIDLYRLGDPSEVATLGLEDYRQHGLCIVEWPQNGGDYFKAKASAEALPTEVDCGGFLTLKFTVTGEDSRHVELHADAAWSKRLAMLFRELARPQSDAARQNWLNENGYPVTKPPACAAADASFRSYWRFNDAGTSKILMDSPPPLEDVVPFVNMATYLEQIGLNVAKIEQVDTANGYLVESDLGDGTLFDKITSGADCADWYRCAVDILVHLYKAHQTQPNTNLPTYTNVDLWAEVARGVDWYLCRQLGHAVPPATRQQWHDAFQPLCQTLTSGPQTTMLWDYHAANLMPQTTTPENVQSLALLDFQDAKVGPLAYDLTMLLEDARLDLTPTLKTELLQYFIEQTGVGDTTFRAQFAIASTIRNLKLFGGFTRLALRDNKPKYLDFMPRCIGYVQQHLGHPALAPVAPLLEPLVTKDKAA